jgi:hypothetical protein
MIWMEFIKVQTSRTKVTALLRNFVAECEKCHGLVKARVFSHARVGDCSLCLLWNTSRPEPQGSSIGLHLSSTLQRYGLVDHSVWLETKEAGEKTS